MRTRLRAEPTERQFLQAVRDLARACGWLCYHTHDSRRSEAGFPDLVLARGDRLLWRELKTARGRVTAAQSAWLATIAAAGGDAGIWRPADWEVDIVPTLAGRSDDAGLSGDFPRCVATVRRHRGT